MTRIPRLQAIDIMRGVVMILMAIDHVRLYAGQPPGGPTPAIFFTRWVTHFAAPAFCFFAGTGAFLNGRKLGDVRALSRYLLERGVVLVVLELTVIREFWAFNFDYAHYMQGNVIWVLGWCMILMAGLVRLFSTRTIGIIGLAVVFGQQVITWLSTLLPAAILESTRWAWQLLYFGGKIELGSDGTYPFAVIYSIVPWIGVMAAGYAFGEIVLRDEATRDRLCLRIGLSATAIFAVVAGLMVYLHAPQLGDPPALLQFLGQKKYPASQLFLMMTLGPTIALLPFAERMRGAVANMLLVFGRVPMFFYLLHIPLIHGIALIVSFIRMGTVVPWLFSNLPWAPPPLPPGYLWSFGLLYFVWLIAVALLYFPCRWYGELKARHKESWLRFI
ncbi:MAG: heparan-alpha-glucosaminide N-acetyltransferase domain-containing protein [bacterium]